MAPAGGEAAALERVTLAGAGRRQAEAADKREVGSSTLPRPILDMCAPPRLTSPAGFCYSAAESTGRTNGNRRWTAATFPSRSPHERPCEGHSRRPFSRDILAPAPPPTELEVSLTQHPTSSTALVLTYVPWPSLPDHSGGLAGAQPHPGDNLGVPPRELRANPGAPNIEEARHITPRHHEDHR